MKKIILCAVLLSLLISCEKEMIVTNRNAVISFPTRDYAKPTFRNTTSIKQKANARNLSGVAGTE